MCVCVCTQSHLNLCDPMDCSLPGSLSMGFYRQEYWSGLPFPSPGDLPDPGIKLGSPALQADSLLSELPGTNILMLFQYRCVTKNTWNEKATL